MTQLEGYIPTWLRSRVKQSVSNAIKYDRLAYERNFWLNKWPLGLLYFEYYYIKEVITDYIETHGDWGEEQIKEGRIFKQHGG